MDLNQLEDEIEQADRVIKAAENWAKGYDDDPESHAKLIKLEAKLERDLRGYFRGLADRVVDYIDWYAYGIKLQQLQAADDFNVEVIVTDRLDNEDGILLNIIYDPIASGIALGVNAGEHIYSIPLDLTETTELIQQAARDQAASLVGKKVSKDGIVVDNPNSKYSITDRTRQDIRESIRTSLSLGEDQHDTIARLQRTVKSLGPKRAEIIAQTESVNAYQIGVHTFGKESGAIGKEWQTVGAIDICAEFAAEEIVPLDYLWGGKFLHPTAHPRCRCNERLVYPVELE